MKDADKNESNSDGNTGRLLILLGFVLSVVWLAAAIWFPWCFHKAPGVPEWCIVDPYWGQASFGETGDYLTGWLTPLALFWFIITVFLQRYELLEQRREFIKGRKAAQEQAGHLERSNQVRKEQTFIDILKESQEVRKCNIQIVLNIIRDLSGNSTVDFDIKRIIKFNHKLTLEDSCHHCLGYIEDLMVNPNKYRIDANSDALKSLYVYLRQSWEFYQDISRRAKDLDIKKLDHYLIGSMESRFRDACEIALEKLNLANPNLRQWYDGGPKNYGSPSWQHRLAVQRQ